jgi:hypothetical protein
MSLRARREKLRSATRWCCWSAGSLSRPEPMAKSKQALRQQGAPSNNPMRRSPAPRVDDRRDPQTGVSDVTQLLSLTEESVMQNTMVRFARDEIYTFVGSVLLAVNPYKPIPSLYGEQAMASFEQSSLVDAPPHVYALLEGAYRKAIHGGGSQSLIISGESGAGKTESTKLALSYLVWRTRRLEPTKAQTETTMLTTSIIQANPMMEAFGNACTARNSNSSRFGKCVRLGLDSNSGVLLGGQVRVPRSTNAAACTAAVAHFRRTAGRVAAVAPPPSRATPHASPHAAAAPACACQVHTYLLEKSRVVAFEKSVSTSHQVTPLAADAASAADAAATAAVAASAAATVAVAAAVTSAATAAATVVAAAAAAASTPLLPPPPPLLPLPTPLIDGIGALVRRASVR